MSRDTMNIVKFLIMAELMLLVLPGYFAGKTGLSITVILSTIIVSWIYIWALAMGAAYTNSRANSPINVEMFKNIVLIALLFTYLACGVEAFVTALKTKEAVPLYFHLWLTSVVVTVISLHIVSYKTDPIRLMELEAENMVKQSEKQRDLLREQEEKERQVYKLSVSQLHSQFENAMHTPDEIDHYITESENISQRFKDLYSLPTILANYTTKLMIHALGNKQYHVAQKLFDSYVDAIVLNSGLSEKSTDVASNGIILCVKLNDSTIFDRLENSILGENFKLNAISNEILLFNLACHYALTRDREKLFPAVIQARKFGKTAEQFLNDPDFELYHNDKKFLSSLNSVVKGE
ncbi:MAG: hypothetical protein HRU20_24225 [Pseudomonadales bacterium]|nr:hypothetical protein [Pseudomonadales bacterium]